MGDGAYSRKYSLNFQCFISVNIWSTAVGTQMNSHSKCSRVFIKLKITANILSEICDFVFRYII